MEGVSDDFDSLQYPASIPPFAYFYRRSGGSIVCDLGDVCDISSISWPSGSLIRFMRRVSEPAKKEREG